MILVLLSGLHWEEVVQNIPRIQDELHLEAQKLCLHSAWHSTGMAEIVLAAAPGDSKASIVGKPSLLRLSLQDHALS